MDLKTKILTRHGGIRLYGITPPKRGASEEEAAGIAGRQIRRIHDLGADGLVIYDLQDEPGRSGAPRPFPFLPTLDPQVYAVRYFGSLRAGMVLYKCVANCNEAQLDRWLDHFEAPGCADVPVLVGAPTRSESGGKERIGLKSAYVRMRERRPGACLGGVAIAERHLRNRDEDERLLAKHRSGCRFFISQTVYDGDASKSLISDYALKFAQAGLEPPPLILSFAPCGSVKTMEFMKWLGISIPRWLENDLRHSQDMLSTSIDQAARACAEIMAYSRGKSIPIGFNVESVSIRKTEIEASEELFRRLSGIVAGGASGGVG